MRRKLTLISSIIVVPTIITLVEADFIYEDFNKTLGLNINGDAATFGCLINETYTTYHEQIAKHLDQESFNETDFLSKDIIGKGSGREYKQTVRTNMKTSEDDVEIHELEAQYGHRTTYGPGLSSGCKRRLRLTPSSASQVGSVFYEKRLPVVSESSPCLLYKIILQLAESCHALLIDSRFRYHFFLSSHRAFSCMFRLRRIDYLY